MRECVRAHVCTCSISTSSTLTSRTLNIPRPYMGPSIYHEATDQCRKRPRYAVESGTIFVDVRVRFFAARVW